MTLPAFARWLIVITFFLTMASPVQAGGQRESEARAVADRGFALSLAHALETGEHDLALSLLESRPDVSATPDGVRLRAALLARLGRTDEALALLEGWMAGNGSDALARFQVGEIHFAAHRLATARLSYRLALAGSLDATRTQIVHDRLAAIAAGRSLRVTVTASVAPDSNLNSATSAGTIDLFGLPFALSEEARRQSGVTAALSFGVERRWPVSEHLSIQGGTSLTLLDAPNRTFDQRQLNVFLGPEWRNGFRSAVSAATTYREASLGGSIFESSYGLRVSGLDHPTAQTAWSVAASIENIDSRLEDDLDGRAYGGQLSRTRYLGPNGLWRGSLAAVVHDLAGPEADYHLVQIAAGRLMSLPFGTSAYIEPYLRRRAFDRPSSLFGVRRDDRELGLTVRLSRRDLVVRGAFPYIQAVTSKSWSNVPLGDYSRNRVEFGLTRDF